MKIAIIINKFLPKWRAGSEIATYNLAEHLTQRGHEICVITSYDIGLPKIQKVNGFQVYRISWPKIRIIGVLLFWMKIFLKIIIIKPDIIQGQDLSLGVPTCLSGKILKIPCIIWSRGDDVYHPNCLVRITTKSILKHADAILALTDDMRQKLKKIYNTEISVIPNAIDMAIFDSVTIKSERELSSKKILFVGRLHPVKGVQYLLLAMKRVHARVPEARLILIGDGIERERLETLSKQLNIQQYVQFIGEVPHEKVLFFMQVADVFVLPSLSEGLPNVILEAMASGLPIVATHVGGIPYIIQEGVNGYLVDAINPESLAEKIILILNDDTKWKKISENNLEYVKKYNWEDIILRLEVIYEKVTTKE